MANELIAALCDSARYDHPVERVELIETHISWVLLTGSYVYKIKKPVNLGFVDFSSLERRHFYCQEEVRLNRRLAPELYLGVVAITGTPGDPRWDGPGPVLDYAVKMVQFSDAGRLDHVLAREQLSPQHCDGLAEEIAKFHAEIKIAGAETRFGQWQRVYTPVEDNFKLMREGLDDRDASDRLARLEQWCRQQHAARKAVFESRKAQGFIRECHGDLHLANMVLLGDRVALFDCLEFNDDLRWIDVASDLAFLLMDLVARDRGDLAYRIRNAYFELSGDYAGLALLPFYEVYRALVRATVAAIRLRQSGVNQQEQAARREEFARYVRLAETFTHREPPFLLLTHGLSGSGKSHGTQPIVEALGAIRIRSDVERKRLFGLKPADKSGPQLAETLYAPAASQATYRRLAELAVEVIEAGYPAIVDATFLKRGDRDAFRELARKWQVPLVLLDFQAPEKVLRQRVAARMQAGSDASEATLDVVDQQLNSREPLEPDEQAEAIVIDAERPPSPAQLIAQVQQIVRRAANP